MPIKRSKRAVFPIVGVGASAGGLEAFKELFKAIPSDTGMAFVVVQHLDPTHKSMLVEIIGRITPMPTLEVKDGMLIKPNHVYITPSNKHMTLFAGRFHLVRRMKRSAHPLSIDTFFSSLAKEMGDLAIGIILSGVGSDGVAGLGQIKSQGGVTFSQDPAFAAHDGMPKSAIAASCVDHVMRPRAIALKLVHLSRRAASFGVKTAGIEMALSEAKGDLEKIFILLKYYAGVDFTHYKKTTVERRIKRRMVLAQKTGLKDYLKYLRSKPKEIELLFQDLLINVTSFFRDPKLFKILDKKVFPVILKQGLRGQPVRVWVPACSTGEEAYSVAIGLLESSGKKDMDRTIQIFASDVNATVIEKARKGWYPESIKADVPADILRRYFVKEQEGYRIAKSVRDMCVFAQQDLTRDPPFSKLDLISCRNMLIYMDQELQKKVMPVFYYALKPEGFLVLGSAESVSNFSGFFSPVDKAFRVYSRKESSSRSPMRFELSPYASGPGTQGKMLSGPLKKRGRVLGAQDESAQARDEELRSALEELQSTNEELQSSNEELETSKEELQATNEELATVNDELVGRNTELSKITGDMVNLFNSTRMPVIMVGRDLCISRFTPMAQKVWNIIPSDIGRKLADINPNVKVPHLEAMLLGAVEHLEMTEQEVQDKEGRWYSMTVGPYKTLENKIDGAVIALADIHSIKVAQEKVTWLSSFPELNPNPIYEIEADGAIRYANQAALKLRGDAAGSFLEGTLKELRALLAHHGKNEMVRQVQAGDRWFLQSIYKVPDSEAVRVYHIDITSRREIEKDLKESRQRLASLFASSIEGICLHELILDGHGRAVDYRIIDINPAFEKLTGLTREKAVGALASELYGTGAAPYLDIYAKVAQTGDALSFETYHEPMGKYFLISVFSPTKGQFATLFMDITARHKVEMMLKQAKEDAEAAAKAKSDFLNNIAHDFRTPMHVIMGFSALLQSEELTEKQKKFTDIINERGKNLLRLVEDLLDVSRLDSGKLELRTAPFDLTECVMSAFDLSKASLFDKEIQMACSIDEGLPQLKGDSTRLGQILANLIGNAVKYTDKGTITVKVERVAEKCAADKCRIRFSIQDTGCGIPKAKREEIFGAFMRLNEFAGGRERGGVGLGLYITKTLVDMMGGKISLESEEGLGSKFVITLDFDQE
ncbi:MAG: PAS domain-containing protein [Candidatus Omnitrophica bacterium]|nr:PAS domain-containing protein [Candidatus Omnitrophota bacterium]